MRTEIIAIKPIRGRPDGEPAVIVTTRYIIEVPGEAALYSPKHNFLAIGAARIAAVYRASGIKQP